MNSITKLKKQRVKEGDVVAIPLSDGSFAFGRMFEHGLGIYDFISEKKELYPTNLNRFLFIVGVYKDVMTSGIWPKVFVDDGIASNSPKNLKGFIVDLISGSYEIYDYETGDTSKTIIANCYGLERVAAWDAEHIVQRIEDTIKKRKSALLIDQEWVPDLLEIDASGVINNRIRFDEWIK